MYGISSFSSSTNTSPPQSPDSGSSGRVSNCDWPESMHGSFYDSISYNVRELKGKIDAAIEEIQTINDDVKNPSRKKIDLGGSMGPMDLYAEDSITYKSEEEILGYINSITVQALNALRAAQEFSHQMGLTLSTKKGGIMTLERDYDEKLRQINTLKDEIKNKEEMIRTITNIILPILIVIAALALGGLGFAVAAKIGGELAICLKTLSVVLIPSSFFLASQIPSFFESENPNPFNIELE